jgi:dephospho-CoA kinase
MMSEKEINMITIGVTGGVGAGKSEILRHLKEHYNSRILMSDNAAKDLERPGGPLYEPLVALLESEEGRKGMAEPLLLPDKEINQAEMARRIFADAAILSRINQLVHPAVNQYILDEIERERKEGKREFFVLESALLLENGYDKILDSMWYIYCDERVRAQRLQASRGYSEEKIRSIMNKQVSEAQFREVCDVVIDNSGELGGPDGALAQVDAAIERIRRQFSCAQ